MAPERPKEARVCAQTSPERGPDKPREASGARGDPRLGCGRGVSLLQLASCNSSTTSSTLPSRRCGPPCVSKEAQGGRGLAQTGLRRPRERSRQDQREGQGGKVRAQTSPVRDPDKPREISGARGTLHWVVGEACRFCSRYGCGSGPGLWSPRGPSSGVRTGRVASAVCLLH